jgi:hypothetical protein
MGRRTLRSPAAGGPVRVLAGGAIGSALIVTLGAVTAPAAGAQAHAGTVTNYKFDLTAVSVLSASEAWAVGDSADSLTSADLLHWNGTSWAPVTIPGLPAGVGLSAVDALSPSNVWAAGGDSGGTLIVHWDGTTWAQVPSPNPSGTNLQPDLRSLSMDSATDGWAVGSVYDSKTGANAGLALHWNGTSWQQVTVSSGFSFTGVASFSPTDATAVGTQQTSSHVFTPVASHWNGTSWALAAALPAPQGVPASQLTGPSSLSAPSATDMWTVGGYFTSTAVKNLAWHRNGTRWTVKDTSLVTPDGSGLIGVTAISPANVWAVGFTNTAGDNGNDQAPVSVHWNGTSWTRVTTPDPPGPNGGSTVLDAVSNAGPGNIWAVGHYAHNEPGGLGISHTLILHWNGTRWIRA